MLLGFVLVVLFCVLILCASGSVRHTGSHNKSLLCVFFVPSGATLSLELHQEHATVATPADPALSDGVL